MSPMANPFSSTDIEISKSVRERMDDLQSQGDRRKPFPRMIDVWWTGMCIGLREGQKRALEGDTVKFATGVIFDSDPWRIAHLQLLGLSETGTDAIADDGWANRVVALASEYANYGMNWLFDVVAGAPNPTLAVYRRLDEILD